MRLRRLAATFLAACAATGSAQAALLDRGGGLIYDDVLNVTWLQDANYARTIGYDADGLMSAGAARNFIHDALYTYGYYDSVRDVTYKDWRLPSISPRSGLTSAALPPNLSEYDSNHEPPPIDQVWQASPRFDGQADTGFNIRSQLSELAYMYYVNLGLLSQFNEDGSYVLDGNGLPTSSFGLGTNSTAPFINVQNGVYVTSAESFQLKWVWSSQRVLIGAEPCWSALLQAYTFCPVYRDESTWLHRVTEVYPLGVDFQSGYQGYQGTDEGYVWLLRDGDVAASPVPDPPLLTLMLTGLGLLGLRRRARKAD